jgi:anti-sigma-K factor RskA
MTQNLPEQEEDDMLAAEYVTGVLPEAERGAFEKRLATSVSLQAQLRRWEEHFIALTEEIEPIAAPKHVLPNLERRLFGKADVKPNLLQSLAFWRGLSFASLAGFAVAATLYLQKPVLQNGANYVAELSAPNDAVKLVAYYDAEKTSLKLNRVAGTPATGRVFQLWLIAGKNPPISLGVLPSDTIGTLPFNAELKSKLASALLAISDEPTGGSPTGQPTGAVLATGQIHAI